MSTPTSMLALQSGVFVTALVLTGLVKVLALKLHLLDLPISRSAHSSPTPVGGGLVIVLLFVLVVVYYFQVGLISDTEFLAVLGAVLVATLGLVDDWMHLDPHWRVPLQLVAAIWSVYWLGQVPGIDVGGFFQVSQPLALAVLAVLALVWLLNLYNFMDGIDGLAGSELIFVNGMSFLIAIDGGHNVLAILSATLFAAGAGFLAWNWPPAKIFMGDVGSGSIGFSLGLLALLSMQQGSMTVWTWVILLGVFIVDATITLLRRCLNGEKWYEGHATHAYQKAARQYKSHTKVTITVLAINCLWLAPLAWISAQRQDAGFYLMVLALSPLVLIALKWKAGRSTH